MYIAFITLTNIVKQNQIWDFSYVGVHKCMLFISTIFTTKKYAESLTFLQGIYLFDYLSWKCSYMYFKEIPTEHSKTVK